MSIVNLAYNNIDGYDLIRYLGNSDMVKIDRGEEKELILKVIRDDNKLYIEQNLNKIELTLEMIENSKTMYFYNLGKDGGIEVKRVTADGKRIKIKTIIVLDY